MLEFQCVSDAQQRVLGSSVYIYEQFQKGGSRVGLPRLSANNTKTTNFYDFITIPSCREKIKDIHMLNMFWLLVVCENGLRISGEKRRKPP